MTHQGADTLSSPWILAPFLLQLLAIALLPFLSPHWWERHYPKISVVLGGITSIYYLGELHGGERLLETLHEYIGFVILLASLFIVAGGIHIRGGAVATPLGNVIFLLSGALLANVIGTTGASMVLIRPWIRINKNRIVGFHAVFFIFLVSNIGGGLTPIGDPPLFLGFLKGVPFWWPLMHLWKPWTLTILLLTAIFYLLDRRSFLKAKNPESEDVKTQEPWALEGGGNVVFLCLILSALFLSSPWREIVMVASTALSWSMTPGRIRQKNDFNLAPMKEVAWIFLGIFATMIPALDYLGHHASALSTSFGMGSRHFYCYTGALSSLLDNAPAYLAFLSVEMGLQGGSIHDPQDVLRVATQTPANLVAISLGAVFFGAMTYIGNGPNFMVKSILTSSGVKTPSFFGYIILYSLPILLPVLALAAWLFLD